MITKFDSSYVGTVDMDDTGYTGTPINDRWYTDEQLAGVMYKAEAYAQQMEIRVRVIRSKPVHEARIVFPPPSFGYAAYRIPVHPSIPRPQIQ